MTNKKYYRIKIDEETKKSLIKRKYKFENLIKRFTGKKQSIPLTKVLKISVKTPIELNYFQAADLQNKLKKKGSKL